MNTDYLRIFFDSGRGPACVASVSTPGVAVTDTLIVATLRALAADIEAGNLRMVMGEAA